MVSIGGTVTATIQIKSSTGKNLIGEAVETWLTVGAVRGWLDFQSGQNGVGNYNAKIQESTHVFLCDSKLWKSAVEGVSVTAENSRLTFNGDVYNVLLIDNPMELNQHMEIYLKYVGGGL